MSQRLTKQYQVGDTVEIWLGGKTAGRWFGGVVVRLEHPAVWVETENGRRWFVTNRRNIRKMKAEQ